MNIKNFKVVCLLSSLFIVPSELLRYFLLVKPEMERFLSMVPNMGLFFDPIVICVWGVITVFIVIYFNYIFWLCAKVYGNNKKAVIISSVISFCLFGMFWFASANMFMARWSSLLFIYPFIYLETIVTSIIASKLYKTREL